MNSRSHPRANTAEKILKKLEVDSKNIKCALGMLYPPKNKVIDNEITEIEQESFVISVQSLNRCRELLHTAASHFKHQERYVHVSFRVSVPRGLDVIVQQQNEQPEQK